MSHQVKIDYKAIAIRCDSICELAEKQIAEFDQMLEDIENDSKSLWRSQAVALKKNIEHERNLLVEKINALRMQAKGVVTGDSDNLRMDPSGNLEYIARSLQDQVNEITSKRMVEMRALLQSLLFENIEENERRLRNKANGIVTITAEIQELLDSISDDVERQFTYLAYLKNDTLRGDALLKAGIELKNESYESQIKKERDRIRSELESAKIEKKTIEKVLTEPKSFSEICAAANEKIIDEKVRQKSLKIIKSAIAARGFIVDKKNIKIKPDTNEVILIGLKASGEKAEFRVFLDGKFIYDFRGYEGQACQNDIQPFLNDLEEVYGIKVTSSQEIWSNPDKISTMKYQSINTNKNKR